MTFGLFSEGVASMALPCSWTLAVPPVLAVLAGRGRRSVAIAALVGVVVGMMIRATGHGVLEGGSAVAAGIAVVAAFVALWRGKRWLSPIGALAISWTVASVWQPCVGLHLGEVLNSGIDHPVRAAVSMISYAVGVNVSLPAVQFIIELAPAPVRARFAGAAAALGGALGGALILGVHASVIALFARWSVELTA